jgi:transposase
VVRLRLLFDHRDNLADLIAPASTFDIQRLLVVTDHNVLAERFVGQLPVRLIGDNAYESDRLDTELARRGVELIAPHRRTRTQRTQDGRPLRRYQRRWKIERLFAWFHNFRRLVVRYERFAENFLGMLHLACCLILLRRL